MTRTLVLILLLTVSVLQNEPVTADDGPAKDVPELQALSSYIGTWDIAITSNNVPFTKGQSTVKWILDGRFVQQTGSLTSPDGLAILKVRTLMTYDQNKKAYRMWQFRSDGTSGEAIGKWDTKTRTMTSIGHSDQDTTTTTANPSKSGIEKWSIVTTNQNNEVLFKISGVNTRRKK